MVEDTDEHVIKDEDKVEDEDFKRLKDIQREMAELLDEAEYLTRITGDRKIFDRARAYWIPHIKTALLNDTEYIGKSMVTMEDTISEIEEFKKKKDANERKIEGTLTEVEIDQELVELAFNNIKNK